VIEGDATDEEVLVSAGVERARYLVAAVPSDAVNMFITFSARRLNPDLVIVSRADEESSEQKLVIVGANDVVHIYRMGGETDRLRPVGDVGAQNDRQAQHAKIVRQVGLVPAVAVHRLVEHEPAGLSACQRLGETLEAGNGRDECRGARTVGREESGS